MHQKIEFLGGKEFKIGDKTFSTTQVYKVSILKSTEGIADLELLFYGDADDMLIYLPTLAAQTALERFKTKLLLR